MSIWNAVAHYTPRFYDTYHSRDVSFVTPMRLSSVHVVNNMLRHGEICMIPKSIAILNLFHLIM